MKKIFTLLFVFSALLIACSKVEMGTNEAEKGTKEFHIRAISEDVLTKTSYELTDGMYNFSWHSDDNIGVQMIKISDSSFDMSLFTNSSSAGPVATFSATGSATHSLGNYAFYPCRYPNGSSGFYYDSKYIYFSTSQTDLSYLKTGTAVASQDEADAAEKATVRLFGTITEDAANPMRHIPLIGIKKGETTDFSFKAATGVLKLTLKSLPATATQIRLDATDYALNGYFVFDTNGEIKESYKKEGYGQKYMNITTSGDSERAFYFPIPTGTIPAGKLTVSVTDGTNVLYAVTNKQDIELVRGEITELPSISVKSPSITISGASTDPLLSFTKDGLSSVNKFCACISNSATNNFAIYPTGLVFSLASGSYHLNTWAYDGKLTNSGQYYLHWVAVSENINANTLTSLTDPRIKAYGVIPFSFLTEADKTAILGNWTHNTSDGCKHASSPGDVPNIANFTFVEGTDANKGNFKVSNFDGLPCTKVINAVFHSSTRTIELFNYNYLDASNHYFARISGESTHLNLVFTNDELTSFYADYNFGLKTGNSWTYYYNTSPSHLYTKTE